MNASAAAVSGPTAWGLSPGAAAGMVSPSAPGALPASGPQPLPAETLLTRCDAQALDFETTASLADGDEPFGQARAVAALQLALAVPGRGYNLFVLAEPGIDRAAMVRRLLQAHAAVRPAPPDWCYVYNFDDGNRPRVLSLPPGEGGRLRQAMQRFVTELSKAVAAALDSDEYRLRLEAIQKDAKEREEAALQTLGDDAASQGVALLRTPQGFAFAPMKDGGPMPAADFEGLPEAERERLATVTGALRERLHQVLHELPRLRRDMQQRIREATRDAMGLAAGHLVDEVKAKFAAHPSVLSFLDEVRQDVIEAGEQLRETAGGDDEETGSLAGSLSLHRYQVNLLVGDGAERHGGHAPVLSCDHPTYANLVGRIDHIAHMGTLLTNFTLIRPGALHRANGGFLLLDAVKVLSEPMAWAGLKRALTAARVVIESLPQAMGWVNTLPLEPEPVPLSLKIVLFGEPQHYYLLQALDPEFDDLFKVAADFEDTVPRDAASVASYARMVATLAREQQTRPLDRHAVARLVEHAARCADDAARLSTHTRGLSNLLNEADAQAALAGRSVVQREDVSAALRARIRCADRIRDQLHDELLRETLLVSTGGEHIGQVNGLVVMDLGDFRFAHPVRVTATTRLGEGELVDIERETTMGGPIHSKGVMILAAFLGSRFAQELPLSLSASLVFEQSYGLVEGDSASLAELCALLSALSFVPVRQSLAVTGSINQFGQVQAVGGVNEKIEGFFDLCQRRGLTGAAAADGEVQGVLIPRANIKHLMLREDVVEAVRLGHFRVHAVDDVDQAITLLTGVAAGEPNAKGEVPPGSINHLVAARLAELSLLHQAWGTGEARTATRHKRHRAKVRHRPRR